MTGVCKAVGISIGRTGKEGQMSIPVIILLVVSIIERVLQVIAALITVYVAIKNKKK